MEANKVFDEIQSYIDKKLYFRVLDLFEKRTKEAEDYQYAFLPELYYEYACFSFELAKYEEALDLFVKAYSLSYEQEVIWEIINKAYLEPNMQTVKDTYNRCRADYFSEENARQAKPDLDQLRYITIPYADEFYYIFDKQEKEFISKINVVKHETPFLKDEFSNILIMNTLLSDDILKEAFTIGKTDLASGLKILKNNLADGHQEGKSIRLMMSELLYIHGLHAMGLDSAEALELLEECYWVPNKEDYRNTFEKNISVLKQYPFYFNKQDVDFDTLSIKPLWTDDSSVYFIYNHQLMIIKHSDTVKDPDCKDSIYFVHDYPFVAEMKLYNDLYKNVEFAPGERMPTYFYFSDNLYLEAVLFNKNLGETIKDSGIVFICGQDILYDFFTDLQTWGPHYFINTPNDIRKQLAEIGNEKTRKYLRDMKEIKVYYNENSDLIRSRIKNKEPKILFSTCLFTTILQYHARDCAEACNTLGYETVVLKEKSPIHRVMTYCWADVINQFKPDVFFSIDHFKSGAVADIIDPSDPYHVMWIQDPLPHLLDKENIRKLTENDLVLNHLINYQKIKVLYNDVKNYMDALVPANDEIYKKYELSEDERKKYSCDICFVCHGADIEGTIEWCLSGVNSIDDKLRLKKITADYYKSALDGNIIYNQEDFYDYIYNCLVGMEVQDVLYLESLSAYWAESMQQRINQNIFRNILIEWLVGAGFKNIKLWGKGWLNSSFKEYAMGVAENGEVLSKIYQCSKIVLGNNIASTAAARAWESMLSGGFYMSNYNPPKDDICDIRTILKENEEIIMFKDKQDLIDKISYYLNNEEERGKMAEIGYQKSLEKMTYKGLMKKMIDKLASMAESQS